MLGSNSVLADGHEVKYIITKKLLEHLEGRESAIDSEKPFTQLGLDSLKVMMLLGDLEDNLGISLPPNLVFEHDTISKLALYIESIKRSP